MTDSQGVTWTALAMLAVFLVPFLHESIPMDDPRKISETRRGCGNCVVITCWPRWWGQDRKSGMHTAQMWSSDKWGQTSFPEEGRGVLEDMG